MRTFNSILLVIFLVVVGLLAYRHFAGGSNAGSSGLETVCIYVGGEKSRFLDNPEVKRLLATRHRLRVDAVTAGSIEMVRQLDLAGKDAVWPSNDLAVEFFRLRGGKPAAVELVFNSPIVIYTGWNITDALIRRGLVEKRQDAYYLVGFKDLIALIGKKTKWSDLGLDFYGSVTIRCTDPAYSNSGNMFAGLVANMMNHSEMVDEQNVAGLLTDLRGFFARLGMMEHGSGDLFKKFIATGVNNSMIVGYENQIVEYLLDNPGHRDTILNSVCVLYPQPTVWSSHPVIALNEKGKRLLEALKDTEIQAVAWKMHGFRSGLAGVSQDTAALNLPFVPETIAKVMPLPSAAAMDKIMTALSSPAP